MRNENAKKQRTENRRIVGLPLLCLDMICSYMTGYSLIAVHEAFPLGYSSFLKPLILEKKIKREINDQNLRLLLNFRKDVKTRGLSALDLTKRCDIPTFIASFLFWAKEKS